MTLVTVLALDPGGSTGWAVWKAEKIVNAEGIAEYYNEVYNSGCLADPDHHENLIALIEMQRTEVFHLVTEAFVNRPEKATASELISRDYIGVVTLWCKQNDVRLHSQLPAMAKGFVTDKKLKAMGMWSTNKHARDALRHMFFYMINTLQMTHLVESWKELA